ncbi:bifunctional folylpolyglutamate synthase/dihydrofolate synthase [Flavobacteriaceae bacterium F89]|uniref:Dihydrofolate synthase/folylpolyglutamate synthase n=1 Tax=Cerina litoralis TaxID=2874477 RepID=A0AAE3EYD6_9FLAO|nr:folylpolyglutamate synthase/dihydrofolate synthase family protein [Cerina litoralis]MCG2462634.1 bifunctional folylpolyglutamate synthase/dihydrofolate synthase [Cerina litoralis]
MTYKKTLDWMFSQLPMYQQKGASALTAKLDNIQLFTARLGHPQKKFKSIHVAGTNGKGSSSHMLASVLQEAGYKVGLYTSPHLKDFRERIRINGKPVSQGFVVDFIKRNMKFLSVNHLSFFEMSVGMAFNYFDLEKVDIAVIEVGLGGRLDATNIIVPEVSLITNIGMDHKEILGNSLTLIAKEKSGIIKNRVPVVISEFQEEIASVFVSEAERFNSRIVFASETEKETYKTDLLGSYQELNVKGIVATLKELSGFKVSRENIEKGLQNVVKNTGLMGRWQILGERPMIVCDTAHNKEGFKVVMEQLEQLKFDRLHFVIGFVKDKALEEILPQFPKTAFYYFVKPEIWRGLDTATLKQKASEYGLEGKTYHSVKEALNACMSTANSDDLIYVGGSNFVVAEVV